MYFLPGLWIGFLVTVLLACMFGVGYNTAETDVVKNINATGSFYYDNEHGKLTTYTCTSKIVEK